MQRWFRANRRLFVAVGLLLAASFAVGSKSCFLAVADGGHSGPVAIHASDMDMPAAEGCGLDECIYLAAAAQASLSDAISPLRLPLTIAFFVIALAFLIVDTALRRRPSFSPRLPGYPPILEFYRLRI